MKVLILLGKNDEYLDYKLFTSDEEIDSFVESISDLMLANIEKTQSLKERLKLAPEYFSFAGRVEGFEVIEIP